MSRPLEDVQDEILDRLHAGESIDREALLAEHPEHAESLSAFFEVLDIVEGTAGGGPELATLGEFRILGELGRGGMGRVYEAEQTSLKRRVALKVLPPTLRLDGRLVSRFRREAEAAGRLRHPGIVPVFSVGEAAGTPFFAMELVEGVSLQQVLEQRRAGNDAGLPADPEGWRHWTAETAAKVADALTYAHEQGILHRDVKPGNILLGENGSPRLTDFGLALDLRAPELTQTGEVFGSPQYMSPEQAVRRETPIDERTDVYSLAVTLYELLTLRLPYDGTTSAEVLTALVAGKVVPPRKADPSIPRGLEQVLLGALSRDPDQRYRSAADFAADLRASVAGHAPRHAPPVKTGRRSWVPIAVGAAVVVAILGLAWSLGGGETPPLAPPGEDTTTVGTTDAESPPVDDAAVGTLERSLRVLGPRATAEDFEAVLARLRGVESPVAKEALRRILEAYVHGPGADDPEARAALGYREFAHEVPERIAFRGHPHLQAVERAAAKRWFGADEERDWLLAQEAWTEAARHADALPVDRFERAEERVRAQIAQDGVLGRYHVTTRWAGGYLLCHLGGSSSSKFDLVALDGGVSDSAVDEVLARGRAIESLLEAYGVSLQALYDAFSSRWQETLELQPLTDPWGGRPDLPLGMRSFEEGVPLVVFVFEGRDSWSEYVGTLSPNALSTGLMPPGVRGFFTPSTGYVYTFARLDDDSERAEEVGSLLHEAVHQLQYWVRRQRSQWRLPRVRQDWFEDGLAEYLSAAEVADDGTLEFTGVNAVRLQSLQMVRRVLQKRGKAYPFFPLGRLVGFKTLRDVMQGTASELGIAPAQGLSLYYDQAWALTLFLNEAEEGRYRHGYDRLVGLGFHGDWPGGSPQAAFRIALEIESDAELETLQEEFQAWVHEHLMELRAD